VAFNFFRKKQESLVDLKPYSFKESFEALYAYFVESEKKELEQAREEFINLTGQFDDEHENFNSKMDDFRTWFVFLYKFEEENFYMLNKVKNHESFKDLYVPLVNGTFSIFQIEKIKDDCLFLKDLIFKKKFEVVDSLHALSHEEGDYIQSSVFQTDKSNFTLGLSVISHPAKVKSFIYKKIKKIIKANKKNKDNLVNDAVLIMEEFMVMRYQLFKYKQVSFDKIYSDSSLIKSGLKDSK